MNTVSENIFQELDFFAVSFALGILLVLVYDCLRIFRGIVRHRTLWISLEDLCYWIMTAFATFAMLYQKNDGLIRGFAIGGVGLGMLLYNQLISRYTVPYIVRFLKKVIHIVEKAAHFLLTPFRKASKAVTDKGTLLQNKSRKIKKYCKNRLKKMQNEIKIGLTKK